MVVEKLTQYKVETYNELFEMYLNNKLGMEDQRMPMNLKRMNAGEDGTDEELIKSLLDQDKDNFYNVEFVDIRDGYFLITIIGFSITKEIPQDAPTNLEWCLNMGENGVWEDYIDGTGYKDEKGREEWRDASTLGQLTLVGEIINLKHSTCETII